VWPPVGGGDRLSETMLALFHKGLKTIPRRPNDDVDACFHREGGAIEHEVIEARVVLSGSKEDTGVSISRSVYFSLSIPGALLVHALGDYLGNPLFYRAVKTDAQNVGPISEHDHTRPPEYYSSRGVGNFAKLGFIFRAKSLRRLDDLGKLTWSRRRRHVGESHDDALPSAWDGFIETFFDVVRLGELVCDGRGNGTVEEGEIQLLGDRVSNLVAMGPIRCGDRHYVCHGDHSSTAERVTAAD
jgi:hypothetical protein